MSPAWLTKRRRQKDLWALKFTRKRSKALGQLKIWSAPILIETQLQGTFDQWKDAKEWQLTKFIESAILLASIIWKIITTVLTTKPGHSLKCMGYLCPRLHTIANFTMFRSFAKKNRGRNDFSLFRIFRYFLFFSHLPNGALKFNKFCEDCEKSWSQRFAAFYNFSLLFCCSQLLERVSDFN